MSFEIYSRNGVLLPESRATVSLKNVEYAYGWGVYENVRAIRGKALFLEDHAERLMASARIIGLEHPFTKEAFCAWTEALLARLGPEVVCNLKILLIGAPTPEGCALSILPLAPLFPDKRLFTRGATAITFPYERLFPQAKTLNMFGSYYAYKKAKEAGCYDALLTDRHGNITEGTRTNVFAIKDRVIQSPPAQDILEGITRLHVLQVAREHGFTLEEGPLPLSDLARWDGLFLTSTSTKILPITAVDAHAFPAVPPALTELIGHFDAFLERQR